MVVAVDRAQIKVIIRRRKLRIHIVDMIVCNLSLNQKKSPLLITLRIIIVVYLHSSSPVAELHEI